MTKTTAAGGMIKTLEIFIVTYTALCIPVHFKPCTQKKLIYLQLEADLTGSNVKDITVQNCILLISSSYPFEKIQYSKSIVLLFCLSFCCTEKNT